MTTGNLSPNEFARQPWKNENLHKSYTHSFLHFSNAPEYAPSEVILASLYRRLGLGVISEAGSGKRSILPESSVGKNGTALMRLIEKRGSKIQEGAILSTEGWRHIVDGVIRSPRQPNQRAKKFVQMTPVVPSVAVYSMAARLRGNPWNPGGLVEACVRLGEKNEAQALQLWEGLYDAISVDQSEDDIWAVFLEHEFAAWKTSNIQWVFSNQLKYEQWMAEWQQDDIHCPARRFVKDLVHVLKAKQFLTRRQWVSVLEAILRIGLGAHVLWISKVNYEVFQLSKEVLSGMPVPEKKDIQIRLSTGNGFWHYGQLVGSHLKKLIRNYVTGRLGVNLLLHQCDTLENLAPIVENGPFRSISSIHDFLNAIASSRGTFPLEEYNDNLEIAKESDPRKIAIKHGSGKNMEEFLRHSLGQRETQERGMESYDQGYMLKRRGTYSKAPWMLAAGPVMILALAYSCTSDGAGSRTVEDLCKHLQEYGIGIKPDEVAGGELGLSLRMLGLVLDSPDAEGGMVLLDPFQTK